MIYLPEETVTSFLFNEKECFYEYIMHLCPSAPIHSHLTTNKTPEDKICQMRGHQIRDMK